jgi:transcription elongation factor GreA-like protein/transcription elongation GreA/GreB family factor
MKVEQFIDYIESEQYGELEDSWLDSLDKDDYEIDGFFRVARELGRHKQKSRALLLMNFVDDYLREKGRWKERLRVLKEVLRHTDEQQKFHKLKDDARETLRTLYSGSPSFSSILKHHNYDETSDPHELARSIESIESWLHNDVGRLFYSPAYGCGRVTEINVKLNVIRVDFERKKDVTFSPGDAELVPLEEGHPLWEKMQRPEEFRRKANQDPAETLAALLKAFGRPMKAGEIKDCLLGAIDANEWTRWWGAARRNPQISVNGKGAQALYEWNQSSLAIEESLIHSFEGAKVPERIAIAKQHQHRSKELRNHFEALLRRDASDLYAQGKMDLALELLELFSKWPEKIDPGFTIEDILRNSDPLALLKNIENPHLELKVLSSITQLFPDRANSIFSQLLLVEENPRVLKYLLDTLRQRDSSLVPEIVSKLVENPRLHPGAFTWWIEQAPSEEDATGEQTINGGRVLLSVLEAIESSDFGAYRNRLKKALESGFFIRMLDSCSDATIAQKIIDALDHTPEIEEYRRERLKNVIRVRFPVLHQREDLIFSTKEAVEKKRVELESLIKVELPTNRKAIGEAAAMGDLRENFEYKAARERQEYLIRRAEQLQSELNKVRIIEPGQIDCSEVRPGTRVVLGQSEDKKMTLVLLGPWDSDPQKGIFSYQAPVGILLLGKLPGDKVLWNEENWTVEKIEPWK